MTTMTTTNFPYILGLIMALCALLATGLESPIPGYEIVDLAWDVEISPGGDHVLLNGTIQEIYEQLTAINPDFGIDLSFLDDEEDDDEEEDEVESDTESTSTSTTSSGPESTSTTESSLGSDSTTPTTSSEPESTSTAGPSSETESTTISATSLEPESTSTAVSSLDKRQNIRDYFCFGRWPGTSRRRIEEGVNYLRTVSGSPSMSPGPGSCGRVSCSYDAAIYLCNDNTNYHNLQNWNIVADAASYILTRCISGRDTAGQVFYHDNWNVIVRRDDC